MVEKKFGSAEEGGMIVEECKEEREGKNLFLLLLKVGKEES